MSSHSHSAASNRRQIELELELDSTLSPLDALASHTRKLTIKSNQQHHHHHQQQHRNQPLPKHQHSLPSTATTTNSSSSSNYPSSPYYSTTASSLYPNPSPSSSQSAFNRPSLHSLIIPNQPQQIHSPPPDQLQQEPSGLLSPHFNHRSEAIRNSTATFATDSTDYVWDRDDDDDDDQIPNDHQNPHPYRQALPASMLRRPSEGRVTRSRVRAEAPTERISSVYGEQESVTDENASADPHAYLYQEEEEEEALEVLGSQQARSPHDHHQPHRTEQYDDEDEEDEDDDDDEGGHSIRYESGQSLSSMNPFQYSHYESNRIPTTAVKSVNFPTIQTHQAVAHNSTIITNGQQDRSQNFNDQHQHHHHQAQQQDMLQTPISLSGSSPQSGLPSLGNPHERVRNFSRPLRPSMIVKVAETDLPTPPPSRQISPCNAKPPSHIGRTRASTTTSRSSIQSSSSSNGTRRSWKHPFAKRRPESLQSNREEEEQASADRRIFDCYDAVDRMTRGSQIQQEHHSTPSITFNHPAYTEEVNRPSHYDYQGSFDHQRNYDPRASQMSSTPSNYDQNRDSGSAYEMAYEGLGKGPTSKAKLDHRLSIYSLPKDDLSIEQRLSKDRYMSRSPVSSVRNSPRSQSPIQTSSHINHSSKLSKNLRQSQLPPAMAKAKAGLANLNAGGSSNGVMKNRTAEDYLQLGIDAHEKGEMERSAGFFERSAREGGGCGTGMLMWGLALRHGWGCQVNETRAFKWLQKAAESVVDEVERVKAEGKDEAFAVKNELVLAVYELGQCFMRGWGCKKDKALAINYFELAAKLGDPDAQQELGFCYSNGKGTKKDLKKAAKYYRMASKQGIEMMGSQWIWKSKYD